MMNRKQFRRLILLYVALLVAELVAAVVLPSGYSQAVTDALANEPDPWLLEKMWPLLVVVLPLAFAFFAGLYGLYTLRSWGRTLSVYSTAAGLLLYPFFGPTVSGGIESALLEASTLVWGAALALAYYSPLSAEFATTAVTPRLP